MRPSAAWTTPVIIARPPFSTADAMDIRITEAYHPNPRVGKAFAQLAASLQLIGINRELSAFDVDRGKFFLVTCLELRTDFFS